MECFLARLNTQGSAGSSLAVAQGTNKKLILNATVNLACVKHS